MSKKLLVATAVLSSLVSLALGYWMGERNDQLALSAAIIARDLFRESVEVKHDGTIVELMNAKRYEEAEKITQLRYYGRLLMVTDRLSSSSEQASTVDGDALLKEARKRWAERQYIMPDAKEQEKLLRLTQ